MKIKEAREAKSISQEKLAAMVGVTRQHIGALEKGHVHPSVPLAKKLGEALECEWTKFFAD